MIKSVKFPKKGKGYLYKKPDNPGPEPDKGSFCYRDWNWDTHERGFKQEKYDKDYQRWAEDKKFYDEYKGQFINPAAKNLIGKTFKFEPGKVNIIFGPNGSGKTTILKAIAGAAGIDHDGFPKPADPISFRGWAGDDEKDPEKSMKELLLRRKENDSVVDWDGNVVYYDNFQYTQGMSGGCFGMMQGSVLTSGQDELTFLCARNTTNSGQKALWLLSKVLAFQKKEITLKDIYENYLSKENYNSTWKNTYAEQDKYYQQFENYDKKVPMTILLDEPEINFDIATVWKLYKDYFPMLCEQFGTQIITVSHSPLVLADDIFNNEAVNVISIDEDYTKEMRELLKNIKF